MVSALALALDILIIILRILKHHFSYEHTIIFTPATFQPVLEEKPFEDGEQDLKIMKFDKSPIMSTYLLAFTVGEFDFVQGVSSDGIQCRVYTPLTKKHLGTFALDVAMKSLSFYKEYFGIAYPLPKLDLVAIGDFPCGKIS